MNIQLKTLTLQCRESREVLDLSHQISFFHGKVSSGKSSIARIIDFCFGGSLEKTPAITRELVSVTLELTLGNNLVLLERTATESSNVRVTWINENSKGTTVSAPVSPSQKLVWGTNVYSLSDLIFELLGINTLKISSNKNLDEAKIVRLSLRNFLWYCYLEQHHLDSSFYRLEDPIRSRNSREVLKFVMGYSTQKVYELEAQLINSREQRQAKLATATELKSFLKRFGYASETDIELEIKSTQEKLKIALAEKRKFEDGYIKETHTSDDSRQLLRKVNSEISEKESSVVDLQTTITDQEALRAEIISTKFKLARAESVSNILSGVNFTSCPACGTEIKRHDKDACHLCCSEFEQAKVKTSESAEILRLDLDSRIKEIENSIETHKKALARQQSLINKLRLYKKQLDFKLSAALKTYESTFLANAREVDRKVATYTERIKGQNKLKEMPKEISKLQEEAETLSGTEQTLKRKIDEERSKLTESENYISALESTFLSTLLTVGLPGVGEEDEVHINRKTWEVNIYPNGEEYLQWNFFNAGSGGKKTLFNVCYLLSLHTVAARFDLPLPSIIMIDTPMKNIDKEVNEDLFKRFYDYLYNLAEVELDKTQFIIIDNSYITPSNDKLSFYHRYMTDDDEQNPPLISYYRGA